MRDVPRGVRAAVGGLVVLAVAHMVAAAAEDAPPPPQSTQVEVPPQTAAAGASTAGVSLPPPPDAANPSVSHVALARRLILATGISRSFDVMIAEFMDQIGNSVTQERPDLVTDMRAVLGQLKPEFDHQSEEMIDQSARIYATLLSEKDIDTILAFYNSEAGKRYVALQPQFVTQLISGSQAWQQKIANSMMKRVREEMKKKGHDL